MTAVEQPHNHNNDADIDPREVVTALRDQVLGLSPTDIHLDPAAPLPLVWGVIIETAHPDAVVSLITLIDGSVSLYVSNGRGCVGCGIHPEVRSVASELLELAQRAAPLATPTSDRDYPPAGEIRFYFLCFDGLRAMQVSSESLNAANTHLGALYFAGQRIIQTIERTGAGQSIAQEIRMAQLTLRPEQAAGVTSCLSVGNAVRRLRT